MNSKKEVENIVQLISEMVSDFISQEKSLSDCNSAVNADLS